MSPPRAVFFDAVGTLIHPEPAAPLVYADVGARFGSRRTAAEIAQRFRLAFDRQETLDRENAWVTGAAREFERWQSIVGEVLDDVADPAACFEALYSHFARPSSWRCEPGAEALFTTLQLRGYQLGLASNFDARLLTLVEELPCLRPLRHHVVVSFEVGFRKPARAFFEALCRRTGLSAGQILHVGDDPANDFEGAREAGMAAVLFDAFGKYGSWGGARIRRLEEVTGLLSTDMPKRL